MLCIWAAVWALCVVATCGTQILLRVWSQSSMNTSYAIANIGPVDHVLNFVEIAIATSFAGLAYWARRLSPRSLAGLAMVGGSYVGVCAVRAVTSAFITTSNFTSFEPLDIFLAAEQAIWQVGWAIFPAAMAHMAWSLRRRID
jgi:hypothetical protein